MKFQRVSFQMIPNFCICTSACGYRKLFKSKGQIQAKLPQIAPELNWFVPEAVLLEKIDFLFPAYMGECEKLKVLKSAAR